MNRYFPAIPGRRRTAHARRARQPRLSKAAPAQSAAPRNLTFEDFEAIKSPGRPVISRDGKLVAYVLDEQIYVVPIAGGAPRAVTAAGSSASDPYWSKDGKSLYFLSDRSDSSQLWQLPLASFGEARQVTHLTQGVDSLRFSPDESRLLLDFTDTDAKVTEPGDEEEDEDKDADEDEGQGKEEALRHHEARVQGGLGRGLPDGRSLRAPARARPRDGQACRS